MRGCRNNAVLLMLVLVLLPLRTALGHALPTQSIPPANASLDNAPAQIEIFFTEALEPSFSSIKVFDSQGSQVDNGDSALNSANPNHMAVTVRSVPDGVYTVVWNVLSTVDGHITAGSFPFAVGNVSPDALAAAGRASQTYTVSPFDIAARWLIFLSTTSFIGGLLFRTIVWEPVKPAEATRRRLEARWQRLQMVALIIFFIGNILLVVGQVGRATGTELGAPGSKAFADLLFTTRGGVLLLARLLSGVILVALVDGRHFRFRRSITLAVILFIFASISLSSHSAAFESNILPVLLDWIHLTGAGVWIGGLLYFVSIVWALRKEDSKTNIQLTAQLIPRFSKLMIPTLGLLGLTGLYSALVNVGSLDNLVNTLYGETLIAKTALVLPMVALGGINLLYITRRMRRAAQTASPTGDPVLQRFRGSISIEILLGALILLVVSTLTTVPPTNVSTEAPSLEQTSRADDLKIDFKVSPGRVGINTFEATITKDGNPVDNALEVSLLFTPTTVNIPPAETNLNNVGAGQYQIDGSYFSLADTWQTQVAVRRADAFDAFANLTFDVGVVGRQNARFDWSNIAGVLIIAAAFASALAWRNFTISRRKRIGLSGLSSVSLAIVGILIVARPSASVATLPVNPIPPNVDSITIGNELYTRSCVPCHGFSGRGDGPVGLTLNPPPANLQIHTAPGVHPDGQLYMWISDGFPGASVMPAFRSILSDGDRWHLVNYLRTFNEAP